MEKKTRGMPACYPAWPDSGWLAGLSSNTGTLSYFRPISTISFQLTVKEAVCGRRRRRLDKNFRFHCESLESVLPQPFVSSPVPCSSTQFLPVRHIALSRNNRNSATKTHQIRICTEPPGALSDERRYWKTARRIGGHWVYYSSVPWEPVGPGYMGFFAFHFGFGTHTHKKENVTLHWFLFGFYVYVCVRTQTQSQFPDGSATAWKEIVFPLAFRSFPIAHLIGNVFCSVFLGAHFFFLSSLVAYVGCLRPMERFFVLLPIVILPFPPKGAVEALYTSPITIIWGKRPANRDDWALRAISSTSGWKSNRPAGVCFSRLRDKRKFDYGSWCRQARCKLHFVDVR